MDRLPKNAYNTVDVPTPPVYTRVNDAVIYPCRNTTHTKPNRDLGWQCPIASGLSHGRHQWIRRVRRFSASAASAPPPLRTSPPPRSARLGSTTSTGHLASTSLTPTPSDLQSDSPPPTVPLHPTVPDPDVQAAAAHLSNTLLNCSYSDWEQAQREDPLCDATRRYIQLGCPPRSLTSL